MIPLSSSPPGLISVGEVEAHGRSSLRAWSDENHDNAEPSEHRVSDNASEEHGNERRNREVVVGQSRDRRNVDSHERRYYGGHQRGRDPRRNYRDRNDHRVRVGQSSGSNNADALSPESTQLREVLDQTLSQNRILAEETQSLEARLLETTELLRQRTADLGAAQVFSNKTDTMSGADLIRKVEGLNSEIFQCAALLTDELTFATSQHPDKATFAGARHRCAETLGVKFTKVLEKRTGDLDLLQLAIQGALVRHCSWTIGLWSLRPRSDDINRFLNGVYKLIWKNEKQVVAARWRSLVRAQGREYFKAQNGFEEVPSNLYTLISGLTDVLIVCGSNLNHRDCCDAVRKVAGEGLSVVAEKALELNRILGEEIISDDFVTSFVGFGTVFDGTQMEDTAAGASSTTGVVSRREQLKVLCTSGLGLFRTSQDKGQPPKYLLKPKVTLESVIE